MQKTAYHRLLLIRFAFHNLRMGFGKALVLSLYKNESKKLIRPRTTDLMTNNYNNRKMFFLKHLLKFYE